MPPTTIELASVAGAYITSADVTYENLGGGVPLGASGPANIRISRNGLIGALPPVTVGETATIPAHDTLGNVIPAGARLVTRLVEVQIVGPPRSVTFTLQVAGVDEGSLTVTMPGVLTTFTFAAVDSPPATDSHIRDTINSGDTKVSIVTSIGSGEVCSIGLVGLLVTYTPPGRPPLAHRQRRDGAATAGPQLAHVGTTGGRPPLAWRQNTP